RVPVMVCPARRASRRRGGSAAQSLSLTAVMVIVPRPSEVPVKVTGAMGRPWPGSWASAAVGDSAPAAAISTSSAGPSTWGDRLTWVASTTRTTTRPGTATSATAPVSTLASPAVLAASRMSAAPAAGVAGGGRPPGQVDQGQAEDCQGQVGGGAAKRGQAERDRHPHQHIGPDRTRDRQRYGEDPAQHHGRKQRGGQEHGKVQRLVELRHVGLELQHRYDRAAQN